MLRSIPARHFEGEAEEGASLTGGSDSRLSCGCCGTPQRSGRHHARMQGSRRQTQRRRQSSLAMLRQS